MQFRNYSTGHVSAEPDFAPTATVLPNQISADDVSLVFDDDEALRDWARSANRGGDVIRSLDALDAYRVAFAEDQEAARQREKATQSAREQQFKEACNKLGLPESPASIQAAVDAREVGDPVTLFSLPQETGDYLTIWGPCSDTGAWRTRAESYHFIPGGLTLPVFAFMFTLPNFTGNKWVLFFSDLSANLTYPFFRNIQSVWT